MSDALLLRPLAKALTKSSQGWVVPPSIAPVALGMTGEELMLHRAEHILALLRADPDVLDALWRARAVATGDARWGTLRDLYRTFTEQEADALLVGEP